MSDWIEMDVPALEKLFFTEEAQPLPRENGRNGLAPSMILQKCGFPLS